MQLIFIDPTENWHNLLPLTATKPIAALRIGILTMAEKWQKYLQTTDQQTNYITATYLQKKYALPTQENLADNNLTKLYINSSFCPDDLLVKTIQEMPPEMVVRNQKQIIAFKTTKQYDLTAIKLLFENTSVTNLNYIDYTNLCTSITFPYDIFLKNREQIINDFKLVTTNRKSLPITDLHTKVYGIENIFVEEGATIKAAILNAEDAPIYIGKNAKIHEGVIIKGAFALCEGAEVNMGAKIKGDTTVGIFSKVGGEVSNSVIMGYSNKGHEGFLGNSVIGEWCNLGADSNTSNLKNNYSHVKIWNYPQEQYIDTRLQFCGTIMADHVKCSINTMLNTGTVIGVGANIFGADFPPKFVSDFAWGGSDGFEKFDFEKFCQMTERVMARRNLTFTEIDKEILDRVYQNT
jgi:UDP-N-acetylglucosamine diphosphorylase/glucosamine-1-phosphate N-acetyltransferase